MDINQVLIQATDFVWGWPLVIFVLITGIITTIALGFIQFRYFLTSWRLVLAPQKAVVSDKKADMTPFQAFLNALSASVGNGSIAGMATAVAAGGPGAAFWVFFLGLLSMSIRFAEVFLSMFFPAAMDSSLGGPMIYLRKVPGGRFLPWIYAFFCMLLGFIVGNAMQSNSIRLGIERILEKIDVTAPYVTDGKSAFVIACILLCFIGYVMLGGAHRIVKISDAIVPIKVGVFFVAMIIALVYHYAAIIPALMLIMKSAFTKTAIAGGGIGFSVQQAMRFGFSRSLNASESGLGTAGILFGAAGKSDPVQNGIMAMLSTFISANLVCFSIMVLIVASGVWDSGLTSTPLTSAAFETVFGHFGSGIVTFLSIAFGLGVLVAYAYITRSCWLFLTNGRFVNLYNILFSLMAFFGAQSKVDIIWNSTDLINAGLLAMNLYGILWLLPYIKKGVAEYQRRK